MTFLRKPGRGRDFVATVVFQDGELYGVGGTYHQPVLLVCSDGSTVHQRPTPDSSGLRALVVHGDHLVVVGEYGGLYRSSDRGRTWQTEDLDFGNCLYTIVELDGRLWIGGDGGYVARSAKKGWKRIKGGRGRVFALLEVDGAVWAVGDKVRRVEGKKLVKVDVPVVAPITGGVQLDDGTVVLVGDSGQVWRRTDSWQRVSIPVSVDLEDVAVVGDHLIAVGSRGTILQSPDGLTWTTVKSGTNTHLWSVCAAGTDIVVGMDGGGLLRLPDGPDPFGDVDTFDEDGPLDAWFLEHQPAYFLAAAAIQGPRGGGTARPIPADPTHAAIWGSEEPEPLRLLRQMLLHDGAADALFEFSPSFDDYVALTSDDVGLFEAVTLRDQNAYLGTGLPEMFAGVVCLGYLGNGDTFHLQITEEDGEHRILHFDHDEHAFTADFARTLSDLVYLSALGSAWQDDQIGAPAFRECMARLAGRVNPSWHFRSMLEDAGMDERWEPEGSTPRYLYYRALWLVYLLRNDGVHDVTDVDDLFVESINLPITPEQHELWLKGAETWPATALYLIWRCFFFDDPHLEDYLSVARQHRSPLVRSAAALIDADPARLGSIDDVAALKAALREQDIDPARAEARAAEAEAAEVEAVRRKEEAAALVAASEDLTELAWTHWDVDVHEAIEARLRDQEALRPSFRAIDYVANQEYVRHNLVLDHERDEAIAWFATIADDAVVPLLAGRLCFGPKYGTSHLLAALAGRRALDRRVGERLRPELEREERYEHRRINVIWVLGALGDEASAERLAALVAERRLDGDALEAIGSEKLVSACVVALGRIGGSVARASVEALLRETHRRYESLRPVLADAVVAIGDIDVTPVLDWPEDRLPKALTRGLVLASAGQPPDDLPELVRRGFDEPGYNLAYTKERLIGALRLARWLPLDPELAERARPFLTQDDPSLRDPATSLFAAWGIPVEPVRPCYRLALQDDPDVLLDMLADPAAIYVANVAERVGELGLAEARPLLLKRAHSLLPDGVHLMAPYPLRWTVQALIALGEDPDTIALLDHMLRHPNRDVKDPVLRDPPDWPQLMDGMLAVQAEKWGWRESTATKWLEPHVGTLAYEAALERSRR